jgi:hypothetical protein
MATSEAEAAAYSPVVQLSEWSVLNNSNAIKIPDFIDGRWELDIGC